LLETVLIQEAMTQECDSVPPTMSLPDLVKEFERTHHHGFTVVGEHGSLYGVVTVGDLEEAMLSKSFESLMVADIATTAGLAVGHPDETMGTALWRMGTRGVGRLPVIDRSDQRRLVGVVRREDVIRAYEQAMAQRTDTSYRLKELREAHEGQVRVLDMDIQRDHSFVGKTVQDIAPQLPSDCILVSIRRGDQVIIPRGNTVIREGDHLVTLASVACEDETGQALE
jgi:CIC family chloride channel protein